ncbi:MAG: c-type cytochrome, partial [Flavobacteriaceae bacterium]
MDFYKNNTVVQKLILGIRNLSILFFLVLVGLFIWLLTPSDQKVSDMRMAENPWPIASFIEATNPDIEIRKGFQLVTTEASRWEFSKGLSSNRLACTNCHLNAGTQNGAASFLGVTSRYPKFSGRDGKISTLADRINGCMERSMNREPLNKKSFEMTAMLAYMQWLDQNYTTLEPHQPGLVPIRIPNR